MPVVIAIGLGYIAHTEKVEELGFKLGYYMSIPSL